MLFFILCNKPLWYLLILLVICLLFWLLRLILNKNIFICLLIALLCGSIVLQYTGCNYALFENAPSIVSISFGRLFEMLPYACGGLLGSLYLPKLLELSKKSKVIIFIVALLLAVLLYVIYRTVEIYEPDGYGYQGMYLLLGAILLVLSAFTNPINFVKNEKVLKTIKVTTSFTLGVFCIHSFLGLYTVFGLTICWFNISNFLACLVIYLVCYLVCFLIYLIPCKYTKLLVE